MINANQRKSIESLFEEFVEQNTDFEFALLLLAEAVAKLEAMRHLISAEGDPDISLSQVEYIKDLLTVAQEKFEFNRFQAGYSLASRYLLLVANLRSALEG